MAPLGTCPATSRRFAYCLSSSSPCMLSYISTISFIVHYLKGCSNATISTTRTPVATATMGRTSTTTTSHVLPATTATHAIRATTHVSAASATGKEALVPLSARYRVSHHTPSRLWYLWHHWRNGSWPFTIGQPRYRQHHYDPT